MGALVAWAASAAWIASAALVGDPAYPWILAGVEKEAGGERSADMDRVPRRDRWGFRRRAYRHAHRTPVLYSRNQSRTNRALFNGRKGGGGTACRAALYELEMEMDRSLSGSQLYYPYHYCDLYLLCLASYLAKMIDLLVYLALTAVAEGIPETQAAAAAVVVAELSYRR